MPFGFEQRQWEDSSQNDSLTTEVKEFLEVDAVIKTNGQVIPTAFVWEGRKIKINKVIKSCSGSSLKNGFTGIRYECIAGRTRFYLYFTGKQWYINH